MRWEIMIVAELLNAEEELARKDWSKNLQGKIDLEAACKQRREILQNKFGIRAGEIADYAVARQKYRTTHPVGKPDRTAQVIADIITKE
jgi:hypothetical protein